MSNSATKEAHSLSIGILLLSLACGYYAWAEADRQRTEDNLRYLEKLLVVVDIISTDYPNDLENALTSWQRTPFMDGNKLSLINSDDAFEYFSMAASGATFSERLFKNPESQLLTQSDPGVRCHVSIIESVSDAPVVVRERGKGIRTSHVPVQNIIVVDFNPFCFLNRHSHGPSFLITHDESISAVVMPPEVGQFLYSKTATYEYLLGDVSWHENLSEKAIIEKSQVQDVAGLKYDSLTSVLLPAFRGYLYELTTRSTGKTFQFPAELPKAIGEVYAASVKTPEVFGISLPSDLLFWFVPIAMLSLSATFLHRVRRIPTNSQESDQDWVLIDAQGFAEGALRLAWLLLLLLAPLVSLVLAYVSIPEIYSMPKSFAFILQNRSILIDRLFEARIWLILVIYMVTQYILILSITSLVCFGSPKGQITSPRVLKKIKILAGNVLEKLRSKP